MTNEKPRDSRTSILKAAIVEFAKHGVSGARMEHIAARSGFNKALLYRYFGSREGLFDSALAFKFEQKLLVHEAAPETLGDTLVYWFENTTRDPRFVQLLLREALAHDDNTALSHEEFRLDYYARQLADLEKWRANGQLDPALPVRPLLLMLSALVSFPTVFPNIARLIVGKDRASLKTDWPLLLREIARRLGPEHAQPPAGEGGASAASSEV